MEEREISLETVKDNVFDAQKELGDAMVRISIKHELTAYDTIVVLEVLKHRTIQFAYQD